MGRSRYTQNGPVDENSGLPGTHKVIEIIISGMNGVAVARYGLILSEDGAAGSRKVFRCLLGLWDTGPNFK